MIDNLLFDSTSSRSQLFCLDPDVADNQSSQHSKFVIKGLLQKKGRQSVEVEGGGGPAPAKVILSQSVVAHRL